VAITKEDKQNLYNAMKSIDVKKLFDTIDDETKRKWSRFGAFDGLRVAAEIILQYPEQEVKTKKKEKVVS